MRPALNGIDLSILTTVLRRWHRQRCHHSNWSHMDDVDRRFLLLKSLNTGRALVTTDNVNA